MRFPFLPPETANNPHLRRNACLLSAAAIVAGSLAWYGPAHVRAASSNMPKNVRVSPGAVTNDGMVVITWDAPSSDANVAYYQVFRYNGATGAKASEVTYIGRTEDARNYFIDQTPTEGVFQYAVIAVDKANTAGSPSDWVKVTADFPSNGIGTIEADVTAPPTPGVLHAGLVNGSLKTVTLNWNNNNPDDTWRCIVYRQDSNGVTTPAGYTDANATSFTDTVPGDGSYKYFVVAQDKSGNVSQPTAVAGISVDNTGPAVDISAPVAGQTYDQSGVLNVVASITDNGSGYDTASLKYYLDNVLMTSPTINLANLSPGTHTVKVEVIDRAGNPTTVHAEFIVAGVTSATAPHGLTAPGYSDRSVPLSWTAPTSGDVTGYTIYRSSGTNGSPVVAGITDAGVTTFTDTVPADDRYGYYVVANNGSTASPASNPVYTIVDTKAPTIAINTAVWGKTYLNNSNLHIDVTASDALSGIGGGGVKYWVDNQALLASDIWLANLTAGAHTFKVQATDRAGNVATETANFNVSAPATPAPPTVPTPPVNGGTPSVNVNQVLIDLLISLRGDMQVAQYNRLLAELRAGHTQQFIILVVEYRGKFVGVASADKLLKACGYKWQAVEKDDDKDKEHHDNGNHYGWYIGKGNEDKDHTKDGEKSAQVKESKDDHGKDDHGKGGSKGKGHDD